VTVNKKLNSDRFYGFLNFYLFFLHSVRFYCAFKCINTLLLEVRRSEGHAPSTTSDRSLTNANQRTLSPVSANTMNSLKLVTNTEQKLPTTNGTVENMSGQKGRADSYSGTAALRPDRSDTTLSPQSTNIPRNHGSYPNGNIQSRPSPIATSSLVRTISSEFGGMQSSQSIPENSTPPNGTSSPQQAWSSAVGGAALGKTSRVIDKLMNENDRLKKDLQLTKLQSEESRQQAKMIQGRIEGLNVDYEDMVHQVTVVETILKRKERQLGEFKEQIDGERRKAKAAQESERNWKDLMETMQWETKQKVDEAKNYAMLMEGRYNSLASHWKEQGAMVDSTVEKLSGEISSVVEERKQDAARMDKLQKSCEQQRHELKTLTGEKESISRKFEEYKAEQESALSVIKTRAREQERINEQTLQESKKVLDELKWALGVKKNVKGAK
jgi:hypothetical protein